MRLIKWKGIHVEPCDVLALGIGLAALIAAAMIVASR